MEIKKFIVHHSASLRSGNSHQLQAIDRYHRDKNWGSSKNPAKCKPSSIINPVTGKGYYAQYHWIIEPNGERIQTARENEIRWHAGDYNDTSLGICLPGNFDIELPTPEQEIELGKLLKELKGRYLGADIVYHRDLPGVTKSCPGKLIPPGWALKLLNPNDMKKIIGNKQNDRQYVQGDDGVCHWLFSPALLESFHKAGFLDKNVVEWRENMDGLTIGETFAVVS